MTGWPIKWFALAACGLAIGITVLGLTQTGSVPVGTESDATTVSGLATEPVGSVTPLVGVAGNGRTGDSGPVGLQGQAGSQHAAGGLGAVATATRTVERDDAGVLQQAQRDALGSAFAGSGVAVRGDEPAHGGADQQDAAALWIAGILSAPPPIRPQDGDSVLPSVRPELGSAEQGGDSPTGAGSAPAEGLIHGRVTHYGESYNGQPLGCGTGDYSSGDVSIVAVAPARYSAWPCGQLLRVCGVSGCIDAVRQDACPGCAADQLDLAEAGIAQVCGEGAGACEVTISEVP